MAVVIECADGLVGAARLSTTDIAAITDAQHTHHNAVVLNIADDTPIADTIFPIIAERRAGERFANLA